MCTECMKAATIKRIDAFVAQITPKQALHDNKAKGLPLTPFVEGIDYYIENGLYVYTTWHHLKRGYCCKNGCRHCPYTKAASAS